MESRIIDGIESLVISRNELEGLLLTYADSEIRAEKFFNEARTKNVRLAELQMWEHQKIKARGFKEAVEGFMYCFTGSVNNVDEHGKLIERGE